MRDDIRKQLENDLAQVEWRDVRTHVGKDAVILVDRELDLVEVGVAVASDAADLVGEWIQRGRLAKPEQEQLAFLETRLDTPFLLLIARPFLLVQEVSVG